MHKDLVKFRKTLASLTCSPLILISNNLELAAKYLPNKEEEPIRYKTNEEVKNFCEAKFGISFPMTQKEIVRGENAHPFYFFISK